jgi:NitT/TauT family transport system permease protein
MSPTINLRKLRKRVFSKTAFRGALAITLLVVGWELGSRFKLPLVGSIPAPSDVLTVLHRITVDGRFWNHWLASFQRIFIGFIAAQVVGIPLGLAMAMSLATHRFLFPILEILRPIPPLAWVPTAIIFWPTTESSIAFVIFLGAFFTVVLNVIGGARSIDQRYVRAALSLGSRPRDVFWKIVLPATLPSIFTGMAVGMGITWEVVVAAEMIAGKSGLGYFTWASYVGGNYPQIIVGMLSIGIAGYLSSGLIRAAGKMAAPWQRRF